MIPQSSYFLYGYFGVGNFGDDILLDAAIRSILIYDPNAFFLVRNHGPLELEKNLVQKVQCTDLERVHYTRWPFFIKFFILLRSYWRNVGLVSTLVVGGGTLIHGSSNLKSTFLLLCLCIIAKIRGRRVLGIGLGAQPIRTFWAKTTVFFLVKTFDRICLRDTQSFKQIRSISGDSAHIILTSDLAYTLARQTASRPEGKIIAVSLADYLLQDMGAKCTDVKISILARVLSSIIKEGYEVRFLPMQKNRNDLKIVGDLLFLEKLRKSILLPYREKAHIFSIGSNPDSISAAYDGVCLTIGMRFHALVFSAIKNIPFIGLADEPKISAICDEFSMQNLPVNAWDEETMVKVIKEGFSKTVNPVLVDHCHKLAMDNFKQDFS